MSIITISFNSRLGDSCEIVRLSEPIKRFWAEQNKLDLDQLLSDGAYKENYRKEMIKWSDEQRKKDYGVFCRDAMSSSKQRVCIVSDLRRKNDIKFFRENYADKLVLIRIKCDDAIRIARGWTFQEGVDDIESECDLDDFTEWDYELTNDGSVAADDLLRQIVDHVESLAK